MPNVRVDPAGTMHAVFLRGDNLYYSQSRDSGASFAVPLQVNARAGYALGGLFRGPELAVAIDGTVHIAWYNRAWQLGLPRDQLGVMYSRVRDGRVLETERNLVHGPADGLSIAAIENRVIVLWHDDDHVVMGSSADSGASFSVSTTKQDLPCECCDTALAVSSPGGVSYVYRDRWQNRRDMYLVALDAHDAPIQRTKLDAESWVLEACPVSGTDLQVGPVGQYAAWEHGGSILLSVLNAATTMARAPLDLGKGKYPVLALSGPNLLLAFKSANTLHWMVLDAKTLAKRANGSRRAADSGRPAAVATSGGRFLIFP